jgi:hypothetical protein
VDIISRKYQFNPNDRYTYPASRTVQALATCPSTRETRDIIAPKEGASQFVFAPKTVFSQSRDHSIP